MPDESDTIADVSVDPYALTGSNCSIQLSGRAYCSALFIGFAVTTLSWVIGVLVLWSTMAMLFISQDEFEPRKLVLGQLSMPELVGFVFACLFVFIGSVFLGLRSRRLVENGWRRTSKIQQRKQELEEQLLAVQSDLRPGKGLTAR